VVSSSPKGKQLWYSWHLSRLVDFILNNVRRTFITVTIKSDQHTILEWFDCIVLIDLCTVLMCSCSLCSKNLVCWTAFCHHFKAQHGIDMQQCSVCTEPVPCGVLMVQHVTSKHLRRCAVSLTRVDDTDGKPKKKKLSLSDKKPSGSGATSSDAAACSVSLSRLWTPFPLLHEEPFVYLIIMLTN